MYLGPNTLVLQAVDYYIDTKDTSVPDTVARVLDNTRPLLRSSIGLFQIKKKRPPPIIEGAGIPDFFNVSQHGIPFFLYFQHPLYL